MRNFIVALILSLPLGCSHKSSATMPGVDAGDPNAPAPGDGMDGGAPDGYFGPSSVAVTGTVDDFQTQKPVTSAATMATAAVVPPPNVSVSGANFTFDAMPTFSVFYMIAGSPPDHVLTYNPPTTVTDQPLSNLTAYTVSSTYLTMLRSSFSVTATAGTATLFVKFVDAKGNAAAGLPGAAVSLGVAAKGPYYLDAALAPTPGATSTSASGWLVWFDVPAGTVKLTAGTGYTVNAADTPTAADDVSLAVATVVKGTTTTPPPTTISFSKDVVPIFMTRGCYNCHSGNGIGRRLGGLVLDGAPMKIWQALVVDISPNFNITRVNLQDPPKSLVLTMPSYENPPDAHPVVVFTSSADPDYQKILTWIVQGAKDN